MALSISFAKEQRGVLYGHLFENAVVGLPRNLYWNLSLPCSPVAWGGDEWVCSFQCEWLRWRVSDWTDLDGAALSNLEELDSVQCSLYLSSHHPIRLESLSLQRLPDSTKFVVQLSGAFDLHGYDELDGQNIPLKLHGEVNFEGIVVVPENFSPKPSQAEEIARLVDPFISRSNLDEPKWDRFRYVFNALNRRT